MVEPLNPETVKNGIAKTFGSVSRAARDTSALLVDRASEAKDKTVRAVGELAARDDDEAAYEEAIVAYNAAFTAMNDSGLSLLRQRERSSDILELVELLINSIANTPKNFATAFDAIELQRTAFLDAEEFARRDLAAARTTAAGAGAGLTAGAAVASLAPTAAMWIATTFGAASTGTAISTLSGAAASSASLAWLGGGAVAIGGGGTAAGSALLALAGPIGWTVAGAALLTSVVLFTKKKHDNREARQKALTAIKENTAAVARLRARIEHLLERSVSVRELLRSRYVESQALFARDFLELSTADRTRLAALVNTAMACAALLSERVIGEDVDV